MMEGERKTAPGWFRRLLAAIDHVMNFLCGVFFVYLGGVGLIGSAGTLPKVIDDNDWPVYLAIVAVFVFFFVLGLWFFREWRRGRRGAR